MDRLHARLTCGRLWTGSFDQSERMAIAITAGGFYAAIIFVVGFIFGTIRVLLCE